MKADNKEQIEDVIAYPVHLKNSNRVRIFEIGNGLCARSRVSEVNKDTGDRYAEYTANNCGYTDRFPIEDVENYLVNILLDEQLIKCRTNGLGKTLCIK